jgi:hypothetical protein
MNWVLYWWVENDTAAYVTIATSDNSHLIMTLASKTEK